MSYVVAALYKFVTLEDYHELREPLLEKCLSLDIKGTLLLAHEGINGTVAGSRTSVDAVLAHLKSDVRLADLEHKESHFEKAPFYRMKVKCKQEIVTMGVEGINPNEGKGQYVTPENWNTLINDPDVVIVDTRNDYEYELGTFEGAVNPNTETFREFPDYVENNMDPEKTPKVAMFCTGGIRCEKSTAFMLKQGFKEVYHLQGGILKYLEEVSQDNSKWQGECYVFDNRVAVNHQLERGSFDLCHGCRYPVTAEDKQSEKYEAGVSCPRCHDDITDAQRARFRERQKQVQLAKNRKEQHIGTSQEAKPSR